ncbi:MAG TPA: RNA methyltransferase, partial [Kiritimatiellae bacterium]|nr:RNA methyltransferase [Kiritimatiellia bacterium]
MQRLVCLAAAHHKGSTMSSDARELAAITSVRNPRIKQVLKLRRRPHRDALGLLAVEGYRELRRALHNGWRPRRLFFCPEMFRGGNEPALVTECDVSGAELIRCSEKVFHKIAYRDRPEGLLAVGPQLHLSLADLKLPGTPLFLVTQSIEKPGNLGTMLRSADAAGAHGVIVCDRTTDINNPNVVRASLGALFALPVVEAETGETINWLRRRGIRIIAASPHASETYYAVDMTVPVALMVGSEQYGLGQRWLESSD